MPANDRRHRNLPPPGRARLFALVAFAMTAFAMNSVLCRLALGTGAIDAMAFTAVRLGSGAVCLALLVGLPRDGMRPASRLDIAAAAMLLVYALAFSFAYRDLNAATGALLLFALVQATMLAWGLRRGERLRPMGWAGVALAIGGLVVLTAPGLAAPPVRGALLMALAGVAWGVYSLRGRGAAEPLRATATNFALAAVPALALLVLLGASLHATPRGLVLAVLSGALASGLGYVAWYAALPWLATTAAATVQLSAPVLAAVGGALLLGEALGLRFLVAASMILGGIAAALVGRRR